MSENEPLNVDVQVTKIVTNPSPTLISSLYLSAPHSMHADPNYFPWCNECQPGEDRR